MTSKLFLRFSLSALLATSCLALLEMPAAASPSYPSTVRDELGVACLPECTLCHLSETGRSGNAIQPFAKALVELGLEAANDDLLKTKLRELEAAGTDSDGDGTADIAELLGQSGSAPAATGGADMGLGGAAPSSGGAATGGASSSDGTPGDPNVSGKGDICANELKYGCGAQWVQGPTGAPFGALLLGAVALLSRARRRRA